MVGGSEHEAEPELVDGARDPLRRQLQPEAERLEHVRRPRGGRDGAVPVLGNAGAGRGGDQAGRRRDVERVCAVAPRPGGVYEVVTLRPHGDHVLTHRLGTAGDLVSRLALRPQGGEESPNLSRSRLAAHDLAHHRARDGALEARSVDEPCERPLDRRIAHGAAFAP
jgi:hypothetical protein